MVETKKHFLVGCKESCQRELSYTIINEDTLQCVFSGDNTDTYLLKREQIKN